jgi:hypothetical protein
MITQSAIAALRIRPSRPGYLHRREADGVAQRFEASTTGGSPAAPRMNIPCEPWPM